MLKINIKIIIQESLSSVGVALGVLETRIWILLGLGTDILKWDILNTDYFFFRPPEAQIVKVGVIPNCSLFLNIPKLVFTNLDVVNFEE